MALVLYSCICNHSLPLHTNTDIHTMALKVYNKFCWHLLLCLLNPRRWWIFYSASLVFFTETSFSHGIYMYKMLYKFVCGWNWKKSRLEQTPFRGSSRTNPTTFHKFMIQVISNCLSVFFTQKNKWYFKIQHRSKTEKKKKRLSRLAFLPSWFLRHFIFPEYFSDFTFFSVPLLGLLIVLL